MIYCVIPRELDDELYDKMVEYYKDNPHVTVILDRREGEDRRKGAREFGGEARDSRPPPPARPDARPSRARFPDARSLSLPRNEHRTPATSDVP